MLMPLDNSLQHPSRPKLLQMLAATVPAKKSSCTAVLAVDGAPKLKEILTEQASSTLS